MKKKPDVVQLVWGAALVLAGLGVFVRIPQVMPKIASIEHFSSGMFLVRLCFYLLGLMLIAGGGKKIYDHLWGGKSSNGQAGR